MRYLGSEPHVDIKVPSGGEPYAEDLVNEFASCSHGSISVGVVDEPVNRVYYTVYNYLLRHGLMPKIEIKMRGNRMLLTKTGEKEIEAHPENTVAKKRRPSVMEAVLTIADTRSVRYMRDNLAMDVEQISGYTSKSERSVRMMLKRSRAELSLGYALRKTVDNCVEELLGADSGEGLSSERCLELNRSYRAAAISVGEGER